MFIGGIPAPVADWTGTRIVAYIPENAPLDIAVQVANGAGSSNTLPIAITARSPASNHVNWRFRMNGPYSFVRPALGSDGTVYSIDKFAHLYAMAPDGGLKWLVRGAGDKGVAVGPEERSTLLQKISSRHIIQTALQNGSLSKPRAPSAVRNRSRSGWKYLFRQHRRSWRILFDAIGYIAVDQPGIYVRPPVDYSEIAIGPNNGNHQLYFTPMIMSGPYPLMAPPSSPIQAAWWPASNKVCRQWSLPTEVCTRRSPRIRPAAICFGLSSRNIPTMYSRQLMLGAMERITLSKLGPALCA